MRPARALLLAVILTAATTSLARADSYWDLESARANARAGGPVSEHDAELLQRYGCLSGTRNQFCEQLRTGNPRTPRRAPKPRQRDAR